MNVSSLPPPPTESPVVVDGSVPENREEGAALQELRDDAEVGLLCHSAHEEDHVGMTQLTGGGGVTNGFMRYRNRMTWILTTHRYDQRIYFSSALDFSWGRLNKPTSWKMPIKPTSWDWSRSWTLSSASSPSSGPAASWPQLLYLSTRPGTPLRICSVITTRFITGSWKKHW